MERIYPNKDIQMCGHIQFEMAGSDFGPYSRYLGYMVSDVNKTKTVLEDKNCLVDDTCERDDFSWVRY